MQKVQIAAAKAETKVAAELSGKQIIKEIYVPGKLVNIVVGGITNRHFVLKCLFAFIDMGCIL